MQRCIFQTKSPWTIPIRYFSVHIKNSVENANRRSKFKAAQAFLPQRIHAKAEGRALPQTLNKNKASDPSMHCASADREKLELTMHVKRIGAYATHRIIFKLSHSGMQCSTPPSKEQNAILLCCGMHSTCYIVCHLNLARILCLAEVQELGAPCKRRALLNFPITESDGRPHAPIALRRNS